MVVTERNLYSSGGFCLASGMQLSRQLGLGHLNKLEV
jgi:hypothetical protein